MYLIIVLLFSETLILESHQASTANLPTAVQTSFQDISAGMNKTITDLSAILTSSDPIPDKVHRVRDTVQERVEPLLAASAARVQEILNTVLRKPTVDKPTEETTEPTQSAETNGHA